MAADPEHAERRVLAQLKNNLAPPQPSLAFSVQALGGSAPRLVWEGPTSWTANELLGRSRN